MKVETQPPVTVLTPVHNGEKYLAECIESVLAQTYHNWEYCIINNCSTDRTLEIAKAYAAKDKRIRLISNSHFAGRQANHNIAFRQITYYSRYCKVVHADDWLFPECIMKMVELAEANPTVGIVGAYGLSNNRVLWMGVPYDKAVVSGREVCKANLLGGPYICGTPTSMLIRADEIRKRQTFYNEASQHADHEVCFDILRIRDFGFVHQILTFTRVHEETASGFADRYNTYLHGVLEVLSKYGMVYLTREEYERQMRQFWTGYYAFLGSKVFRNREKGFWEYHQKELLRLGYSLKRGRIAKAMLMELLDLAMNPLSTTLRIATKIQHSLQNGSREGC